MIAVARSPIKTIQNDPKRFVHRGHDSAFLIDGGKATLDPAWSNCLTITVNF
jgi:hypothetical protein